MKFNRLWPFGLFALALASSGCDTGRKNPPDVVVRVLNATANYPPLSFWRGAISLKSLDQPLQVDFLGGDQVAWDEDTYNFHVSYIDNQSQLPVQVDAFTKQVTTGTWYTFVLYQKAGNVTHIVLESPPVSTTATDVQVQAFHAVEGAPTVDLYLVAPGADLASATPWGTLAFEGTLAPHGVAAGDYVFIATEAGNRAHVLYTSSTLTLSAGAALTFALAPDSGEGIRPFNIAVLNDTATVLVDSSVPAGIRAINGAEDRQPRDVAINNEFTPPLLPGTVFVTPTPHSPVTASDDVPVSVTPPGNPGVVEGTAALSVVPGAKYTLMFTGPAGALLVNPPQDDWRRVKSQAKLNFYDVGSLACALCDVLVLLPGTDPNSLPAYSALTGLDPYLSVSEGSIVPVSHWAGDFEVTVRVQGTLTIVSGPKLITLNDAGIYGIILSDNPNGTTMDMTLIDDFQH